MKNSAWLPKDRCVPEIEVSREVRKHTLFEKFLRWTVIPLKWIMQVSLLPYMGYVARKCLDMPGANTAPRPYEPPQGPMNSLLLMLAATDRGELLQADPEKAQGQLNACMESIQHCEELRNAGMMMFASLLGNGLQPEDAMTRVMANWLELGMYVERRLRSVDDLPTVGDVGRDYYFSVPPLDSTEEGVE